MEYREIVNELWIWTPFLAEGFLLNILISIVAMLLGTVLGWWIAVARISSMTTLSHSANLLTSLFRNIPSFVFMFYLAFVLPVEFNWGDEIVSIPVWMKAAIALWVPVVGFASDQSLKLLQERREGVENALAIYAISWTQYFLIIIMASATASVIGVNEIVAHANTVIAALRAPEMMLWIYLYVALWFLLTGFVVSHLAQWGFSHFQTQSRSRSETLAMKDSDAVSR